MQAGKLNRRVTIQQRAEGQDSIGQPLTTWEEVATVWASIRHLSGVETIKSSADTSIVRTSIRIRFRAGIHAAMRVVHGTDAYEIKAVMPDLTAKEYVDLVCEKVG